MQNESILVSRPVKVAIIGTNGLPARYGGFETLANYLTLYSGSRFELTVFCPRTPIDQQMDYFNGATLKYLPLESNGLQSSLYDIISMFIAVKNCDTLLILGTPGCIILPLLRFWKEKKILVNFGGLEWKRGKWGFLFRAYLRLTEAIAVHFSSALIVDNKAFVDYVDKTYHKECILIEYGGDHALPQAYDATLINMYPFLGKRYFISVSRAQPDNNIHMVLEAFTESTDRLVLISNWNNNKYGKALKEEYSKWNNISLLDAIYDINILNILRSNATGYIHSHSFCGSAPSLIEAMYLGLPIFSYSAPTNTYTTEGQALYFSNSEDLRLLINSTDENKLNKQGQLMKSIADKRYTWKRIVKMYENLY